MLVPMTLSMPVDMHYRGIAVEFAGKFAELSGGAAPDVTAFAMGVQSAVSAATTGASDESTLTLALQIAGAAVVCRIGVGGASQSVHCPLPARPEAGHA